MFGLCFFRSALLCWCTISFVSRHNMPLHTRVSSGAGLPSMLPLPFRVQCNMIISTCLRFLLVPLMFAACAAFTLPEASAQERSEDPLAEIYSKELPSSVESLMAQFRRERAYEVGDFPLEPAAFRRFQEEVVTGWAESLGMEDWVVRNPPAGNSSPIAAKFKDRIVKRLTLDSGVAIEAHVVEILDTGDQIPVVLCLPRKVAGKNEEKTIPGILCCPGHGQNGLRDLVFDRKSYQRAIAVRLAEAGFASVAVEKIDCGYLSRSAPTGNDEKAITTFRLGLGKDTTRAIQLKATVAATEILATHPRVDENRIGATGVSLGGWLAIQTGLLSDRIQAAAEYATKSVFLGDDVAPAQFVGVGDICHIVPGSFRLGDRNILMFPFAPRPLLSGHGGPTDRNSHREHQQYYTKVHMAQYKALGKPENFRYHMHDGGHSIHPETVIAFFDEQFRASK